MKYYKILSFLLCILFTNVKISCATEVVDEIEAYNKALNSKEMREKWRKLHLITLDVDHPHRLSSATKILEHSGSTMRRIFCYVDPDPNEKKYIDDACKALHEIVKNPQNPLNQCVAARALYREAKRRKYSSIEAAFSKFMDPNEEFLHQIVMDSYHPEQCRAAIALLDENTIGESNYGFRIEIPLALMILTEITQTPGHKDCFKAALAIKGAWTISYPELVKGQTFNVFQTVYYYKPEDIARFKGSFVPVCVDVVRSLNDENLFAASSILLHLYEKGFNINEEHKSLALQGLRHVIGKNDQNKDDASMLLGDTVVFPKYKRTNENASDLKTDLNLVNSVLFKSAEDEANPNQLAVLRWLIDRGPESHIDRFYEVLKEISKRNTKGIGNILLLKKIYEAGNLIFEINRKAERITRELYKAIHYAATQEDVS